MGKVGKGLQLLTSAELYSTLYKDICRNKDSTLLTIVNFNCSLSYFVVKYSLSSDRLSGGSGLCQRFAS